MPAQMIPFPRLAPLGNPMPAQRMADMTHYVAERMKRARADDCANGMPGHPPCRSVAELEALLRARADVTAAREGA